MSVSGVSTDKVNSRSESHSNGAFGQAVWLAKTDIRRTWISYLTSGLFMLFFGLLAVSLVGGVLSFSGFGDDPAIGNTFNAVFADFFYVIMGCLFVVNSISMEYVRIWNSDVFTERTAFLKGLPISTRTIVFARVISMLAAAPLNVMAFFLPSFLLTELGELGFSYVWFVGIWLGWGILYAGVTLMCELGLSGRAYVWLSFPLVFGIIAVVLVVDTITGYGLVAGAANVAASGFGVVAALVSVAIGLVGFYLLANLTVRIVDRREVGS